MRILTQLNQYRALNARQSLSLRYFLRGLEPSVDGTREEEKESSLISQHLIVFIGIVCIYRAGHINSRMTVIFHKFSYLQYLFRASSAQIIGNTITPINTIITMKVEFEFEFECTSNLSEANSAILRQL